MADYMLKINLVFDVLYVGPLRRHTETAGKILERYRAADVPLPEIKHAEGLREYNTREILTEIMPEIIADDPSMESDIRNIFTDRKSFQRVLEASMSRWISGTCSSESIERWTQFKDRVYHVIDRVMSEDGRKKKVGIVSSGGPISVTVGRALNLSGMDILRVTWQIVNASLTRFKCTETELVLASFNEYTPLEMYPEGGLVTYR